MKKEENKKFNFTIKISNETVDRILKDKMKRALFIYIYLVSSAKGRENVPTSISILCNYLKLKSTSKNSKTIKEALNYLIDMNLIEVANTQQFKDTVVVDDLKPNDLFFVVAEESDVEEFFTLIDVASIDKVLNRESIENIENMMALLVVLCRQIERRDNVLQVSWFSKNKLVELTSINSNAFKPLIDEMKRLEIIYFNKAKIKTDKFKKEHYIYSMYDMADHVETAISVAEENGKLDARVKLVDESKDGKVEIYIAVEPDIDEETGEILWIPTNYTLNEVLFSSGFEMNQQSARVLNEFAEEFSLTALASTVKMIRGQRIGEADVYANLVDKDNATGFILNGLKEKMEDKRRKEKLVA